MIIHDLSKEQEKKVLSNLRIQELLPKSASSNDTEEMIVSDNGTIRNCVGCFGCWIKTPGACIIRDDYGDMGELLAKSSELLVISRCCYGGFSPFVKNVFDRSISYVHPKFTIRKGEMHHRFRYPRSFDLKVVFYGEEITETEKETARKLMEANVVNFGGRAPQVIFLKTEELMEGMSC